MQTRERARTSRLVLVALAFASAVLAFGAGKASAGPAVNSHATTKCWQSVVNDWIEHNGTIKNTYPLPCYSQAIQHLNAYADIQGYSNIIDDIHRAELAAMHQQQGGGGPNGSSGPGGGAGPSSSGPGGSSSTKPGPHGAKGRSWVQSIADRLGPGNARSIPLPLLVLGALALLLLLAAVATWFAKRVQARRVTPAPAPARVPRDTR
jgi:hypothetical protein